MQRAVHRLCRLVAQGGRRVCGAQDEPVPRKRRLAVEEPEREASDGVEVGSRRRVRANELLRRAEVGRTGDANAAGACSCGCRQ